MRKTMITALRWVVALPAAAVGAWILYLLNLASSNWFIRADPGSFTYASINIMAHGLMGWVFVFLGAFIVPSHRVITAIVLTAVAVVVATLAFIGSLMAESGVEFLLMAAAVAVGAVAAAASAHANSDEVEAGYAAIEGR